MIISAKKTEFKKQLSSIIEDLVVLATEYNPLALAYNTRYHRAPISKVPVLNKIIPWLYPDGAKASEIFETLAQELDFFLLLESTMAKDTGRVLYLSDYDIKRINDAQVLIATLQLLNGREDNLS